MCVVKHLWCKLERNMLELSYILKQHKKLVSWEIVYFNSTVFSSMTRAWAFAALWVKDTSTYPTMVSWVSEQLITAGLSQSGKGPLKVHLISFHVPCRVSVAKISMQSSDPLPSGAPGCQLVIFIAWEVRPSFAHCQTAPDNLADVQNPLPVCNAEVIRFEFTRCVIAFGLM